MPISFSENEKEAPYIFLENNEIDEWLGVSR